jgi:hypothetical protein
MLAAQSHHPDDQPIERRREVAAAAMLSVKKTSKSVSRLTAVSLP